MDWKRIVGAILDVLLVGRKAGLWEKTGVPDPKNLPKKPQL